MYLLVQLKELLLSWHICLVQVVAAHLILILEQHLPIRQTWGVLDVLEMLHPLQGQWGRRGKSEGAPRQTWRVSMHVTLGA